MAWLAVVDRGRCNWQPGNNADMSHLSQVAVSCAFQQLKPFLDRELKDRILDSQSGSLPESPPLIGLKQRCRNRRFFNPGQKERILASISRGTSGYRFVFRQNIKDTHERRGTNLAAKIAAKCLTTAQITAKILGRWGLKSLSSDFSWQDLPRSARCVGDTAEPFAQNKESKK